jgi:tetratricopeptide (TPR) repeat protein
MAAQSRFWLFSSHGRLVVRAGVLSAVVLGGLTLTGCADVVTQSKTETARGRVLLSEGEPEEATMIFANQARRGPRNYKAHYYLGESQLAGGRPHEGIRSLRTALEVMPLTLSGRDDEQYRFLIVDALSTALAQHDLDGEQLAQIEANSKGDKTLKLLIAMTHAKAGRPDSAIESFNQAFTLDRNDQQTSKQFGLYMESIAQNDPAEYYLRRAYRLNTQDEEVAEALLRLGIIPGPALMSATELSKPPIPLGPLPEIKWNEKPAQEGSDGESETQVEGATKAPAKTLN